MNVTGTVVENGIAVSGATVESTAGTPAYAVTGTGGHFTITNVEPGTCVLTCHNFGSSASLTIPVPKEGDPDPVTLDLGLGLTLAFYSECDCHVDKQNPIGAITPGQRTIIQVQSHNESRMAAVNWELNPPLAFVKYAAVPNAIETMVPANVSLFSAKASILETIPSERTSTTSTPATDSGTTGASKFNPASTSANAKIPVWPAEPQQVQGEVKIQGQPVGVRLHRTASDPTLDQSLWVAIRSRTRALAFDRYQDFMDGALNWEERRFKVPDEIPRDARGRVERDLNELGIHMHGVGAYQVLKHLTEVFLLLECGVRIQREGSLRVPFDAELESRRLGRHFSVEEMETRLRDYLGGERAQLPYITRVVRAAFPVLLREGAEDRLIGAQRINEPCLIELIWSYWMEEGMLVQTINAITRRFQNMRGAGDRDPLANLEIDPLRPLNNLLWGYIQDKINRLSVRRRAFEYDHHYGLTLYGKATAGMHGADSRSKFLEAFHNLLHQTSIFFKEDFQTTVIADGFPLLNSLREVHLILAQGAHNQFGDLPWTARVEMMLTQYMLARPEIRAFLQGRIMVPYREPWEPQVDAMKTLQGWTDVTVSHFRDLAVYGEQLLLSIRYGDWIADNDEYSAINWARYFRPEIQGYLHAYRAATGIDLTAETVDATIPGILLQKRAAMQRAR